MSLLNFSININKMDSEANFDHDEIDEFVTCKKKKSEAKSRSPIDWQAKTQKKV